ncbi:MAG: alkaline phosphatase family protein, partial [Acidimicrobiales bacterium]
MGITKRGHLGKLGATGVAVGALALGVGMMAPGFGAVAAGAQPGPGGRAGQGPAGQGPGGQGVHGQGHHLNHVFVIMLENHSRSSVIGDRGPNGKLTMPYLTHLAHTYGMATHYYGVTHPSEPNYIAATSGSTWDVNNDSPSNRYDHRNIVDELAAHHLTWDAYMQAIPSAGYGGAQYPPAPSTGSDTNALYVAKHDPFMLYTDVRSNPARRSHVKPYSALAGDLNSGRAPNYVWISPDTCDDLHGGVYSHVAGRPDTPCPYNATNDDKYDVALKHKADAFVKGAVTTIMDSKAWTGNSAIWIVADEGSYSATNGATGHEASVAGCCDSPVLPAGDPDISKAWPGGVYGGGLVPAVVVSRNGPRHAVDNTPYNHYSMLLTIEEGLGLGRLGYT